MFIDHGLLNKQAPLNSVFAIPGLLYCCLLPALKGDGEFAERIRRPPGFLSQVILASGKASAPRRVFKVAHVGLRLIFPVKRRVHQIDDFSKSPRFLTHLFPRNLRRCRVLRF